MRLDVIGAGELDLYLYRGDELVAGIFSRARSRPGAGRMAAGALGPEAT